MKKLLFAQFFGIVACALFALGSKAQSDKSLAGGPAKDINDPVYAISYGMGLKSLNAIGTPVAAVNIGEKIMRSFDKSFGHMNDNDVAWSQITKKTYLAQFDLNGRKTRAYFHNNGFMEYAVSYGVEKNLPKDVRRLVRSNYVDYNIGTSCEVTVSDKKAWVVNLEDENNLVIARIMDGAIDELAQYQTKFPVKRRTGKVVIPKQ